MKRRQFIALLGSAAAWPVVARAQQSDRIRRIGGSSAEPVDKVARRMTPNFALWDPSHIADLPGGGGRFRVGPRSNAN
jgi:hypothetical protein